MPPDNPETMSIWWSVCALTIPFVLHLLISLAQLAVTTLGNAQLTKLADDGDNRAERVLRLYDDEDIFAEKVRLLGVILGFIFAAASLSLLQPMVSAALQGAFSALPSTACAVLSAAAVLLAAVAVWLTLCELLPRRIVETKARPIALGMVGVLQVMLAVITPLWWLLGATANVLSRLCGIDPHEEAEDATEDEILKLVDEGEEKGVIEESQKEMINNIFEFDDLTAAEVMTPRTDIEAIEADDGIGEVLSSAVEHGVSRLPVYEDDIDNVVGVINIKDLLPFVGQPLPDSVTVRSLMREPLFVPETKKCGELFSEMTALHAQMAMVVDEYGGIAGLVTMEDLLEAIVGNMQDEYDNEEDEVTRLDDNRYEVDGTTDIEEVAELLGIDIPEGDYDTLAGFLMSRMGRIPDADEHPQITFENAVFTIMEMDDRRIETVHVEMVQEQ